jgi:gonadotropin-releasing hormone receptor
MESSPAEDDKNLTAITETTLILEDHLLSDVNSTELPSDMQFNSSHVVSIVGYSSLFLVSSIANITVLRILVRRYRKTKSRVNLLLIHLAIADLIVTFLMMPLEIGWSSTVMWMAGDFLCRFFTFFRIFGLFLSSNILICISLDRFYAIVCPLSTGTAARNMKILLLASWILSILCASPQVSSIK